jgi:hypothetical protein
MTYTDGWTDRVYSEEDWGDLGASNEELWD